MVLTDGGDVKRTRGVLGLEGSAGLESVSDIGGSSVSTGDNDGKTKGSELLELGINTLSPGERRSSLVTSIRDTVDKRACEDVVESVKKITKKKKEGKERRKTNGWGSAGPEGPTRRGTRRVQRTRKRWQLRGQRP